MVSASTSGEAYFDYPYSLCGPPGSSATQSFAQGETSYLCINFNGKTKSIFTVTVDQFAAISVSGCKCCAYSVLSSLLCPNIT